MYSSVFDSSQELNIYSLRLAPSIFFVLTKYTHFGKFPLEAVCSALIAFTISTWLIYFRLSVEFLLIQWTSNRPQYGNRLGKVDKFSWFQRDQHLHMSLEPWAMSHEPWATNIYTWALISSILSNSSKRTVRFRVGIKPNMSGSDLNLSQLLIIASTTFEQRITVN